MLLTGSADYRSAGTGDVCLWLHVYSSSNLIVLSVSKKKVATDIV